MNREKAYNVRLVGKVQGVLLRKKVQSFAQEIGIVGYVKNNSDGSVTIIAQGAEFQLTQFLNYCKQGSALAEIQTITFDEIPVSDYSSFEIKK